ncbi:RNA-binding protein [Pseudoflavitalea sp. G-6-1-2]|uniref:RNA recognition motif domain-containing protein n=1 Tax=Pseudoflavitalea sp. G-6-1-2 TaxID=2728841 RepID=UPI00146DEA1D|nr:RNA-binding protein [Pseudoflavitalea sp. G-6-1-2]NML23990.1 RNA-binding protein [Pseudoflavitalea sp. G-6-1-2]
MIIQVYNLSPDFTDKHLRKIFEAFGTVLNAEVSRNPFNGRSNRNGMVEMLKTEDGEKAIQLLDRSIVEGKIISVSPTNK